MSRRFVLLLALVCLFALANARPERNSFVNKKVGTVSELVNQIRTDAEVRDRYMRHFAMSQDEVMGYVSSLHLAQLDQAGNFTVYSVPEDGMVKLHGQALKKGERVFADAAGNPVLLARCGNPLTLGPSKAVATNESQPFVVGNPVAETREIAFVPETVPEKSVAILLPPTVGEVPVITSTPPPTGTQNIPITPSGGGGTPLAILGALGGAALLGGGGGGSSPVPEPMSMIVLSVGLAGVMARARKKR